MMNAIKLAIPTAAIAALVLSATPAFANPPMPECVDNPACQQGSGCSFSGAPVGATGVAAVLVAGAAVLVARRRRR